jgi:hypothetical protein
MCPPVSNQDGKENMRQITADELLILISI